MGQFIIVKPMYRKIYSDWCNIGPLGMKYFSKGKWNNLKELNIERNCINKEGIKFLSFSCLPKLTSLKA